MPDTNGKFRPEDHDTLIRVETKLDQLTDVVKEIKDGTAAKLADLDMRTSAIEGIVTEVKPLQTYKDFLKLKSTVHDAFLVAKVWQWLAGTVGAGVFWVITQIPNILKAWGLR